MIAVKFCVIVGLATAAGCQLVASCDIAVASEKASFATPGYNNLLRIFCICDCG